MITVLVPPTTATLKPLCYNSTGKYLDVFDLQYSNTQTSYFLILPQIEPIPHHHGYFNQFPDPAGSVKMIYLHGFKCCVIWFSNVDRLRSLKISII